MDAGRVFDRYRELQSYVGWTDDDARRVAAVAARWGFGHPGRFATAYRARFGEPPGTTMHR